MSDRTAFSLKRTVGFGDLSLTVAAARGLDRAAVARALSSALEAGIDLVDVAPEDDTERLAGETVRAMRLRDKVITATRVPSLSVMPGGAPTRDLLVERLPPRYVVSRVEAALRASRLDVLPLVQLDVRAAWRASSAWPELAGTCARLVREGKVLDWGAFVARIEDDTPELVKQPWLAAINVPYSLCEREADPVLAAAATAHVPPAVDESAPAPLAIDPMLVIQAGLPAELVLQAVAASDPKLAQPATAPKAARESPIAVLARRPLAGGALAGVIGPGVKLKPRDDRAEISARELERVAVAATKLSRFVKQVPPVARSCDAAKLALEQTKRPEHVDVLTLAELGLRFVITRGAIALPRLHRHEHVLDAFAASALPPLDPAFIEILVENLDN
jgi:aryl-alcohol dehydrogenase-like predicted oxidoreductase